MVEIIILNCINVLFFFFFALNVCVYAPILFQLSAPGGGAGVWLGMLGRVAKVREESGYRFEHPDFLALATRQ